eukprot:58806_1
MGTSPVFLFNNLQWLSDWCHPHSLTCCCIRVNSNLKKMVIEFTHQRCKSNGVWIKHIDLSEWRYKCNIWIRCYETAPKMIQLKRFIYDDYDKHTGVTIRPNHTTTNIHNPHKINTILEAAFETFETDESEQVIELWKCIVYLIMRMQKLICTKRNVSFMRIDCASKTQSC